MICVDRTGHELRSRRLGNGYGSVVNGGVIRDAIERDVIRGVRVVEGRGSLWSEARLGGSHVRGFDVRPGVDLKRF